jgi:RNA polymerase sigma-54 factor
MLKPSLQVRLTQQLTMTPQLQQAIRLLQLPVMELQTQIQEALEENLMLEVEEPAADEDPPEGDGESAPAEVEAASDGDWPDTQQTGPSDTSHQGSDFSAPQEYVDHSEETLQDHLLWQLELENFDPRTTIIGQAIIDAVNDDGYLTDDLDTIRATLAPEVLADVDEVEAVLSLVQRLDPVGIGARSVSECILLQLSQLERDTPGLKLAKQIAAEYLELVADHQLAALKRRLQANDEDLGHALALVRACHPRPGASINAPAAEYVVPDVFVRKVDGRWVVELNASVAPRLRVNQAYAGSLGRTGEYDILRAQLQEARWLIRSLEIRNDTMLRVATTIVQRQREFLEQGEELMKPLVLRDVAEAVEMHESTISRVTTNKYMHTPRGVFEFRHFFSSHLASNEGDQSSTAVRAKIRRLISQEDASKPFSDNRLAKILADEGIKVARRTVAKYREAMKIPSSSERKRPRAVQS